MGIDENAVKNLDKINIESVLPTNEPLWGTSFSTPIRTAKLALNDMMQDVL